MKKELTIKKMIAALLISILVLFLFPVTGYIWKIKKPTLIDLSGIIRNIDWNMTKKDIENLEKRSLFYIRFNGSYNILTYKHSKMDSYEGKLEYALTKEDEFLYIKFTFKNADEYKNYIIDFKETNPDYTSNNEQSTWNGKIGDEYTYFIASDLSNAILLGSKKNIAKLMD